MKSSRPIALRPEIAACTEKAQRGMEIAFSMPANKARLYRVAPSRTKPNFPRWRFGVGYSPDFARYERAYLEGRKLVDEGP